MPGQKQPLSRDSPSEETTNPAILVAAPSTPHPPHPPCSAGLQALGIAGFALLTALGAQVQVHLFEPPFTLQTVFVYSSGLYLGWRGGLLAMLAYLTLGLFLPVFAGDGYGPEYLFGARSAGYLLGMPLAAAIIGRLSRRWNRFPGSLLALIPGSLVLFTVGVLWLHFAGSPQGWAESIQKGWLRYAPIDFCKILLVSLVHTASRSVVDR